ncbi:phosphoribosylamine--glycine ligase [Candidatus Peregrinibacteria bacterium]|nr:phosphoribosylamine--glycine ligase [Candidatus Peregrinibacteria bacterium]MBI3816936.1 phosphoribosylamine--glycine ligase [Candidatus Peregrinibacteria bacterium]
MKILLMASSAREHAVAEALVKSRSKPEIIAICSTKNPGIANIATEMHVQSIMDFPKILEIAKQSKPDFAFIGPDDPIGGGLVDALETIDVPSVAPKKNLARIESSKGFARNLLQKYDIHASPRFKIFDSAERKELSIFMEQESRGNFVVKYDALKGGKGVKVSGEHLQTIEEGIEYAIACIEECGQVVIEEKLIGVEFSLMSFVSGTKVVDMPAIQDHKRAFVGDTGPNTGGMGTYSDADHSLPFLQKKDLDRAKEINRLTAEALERECGEPFKGILYGGFMAVKDGVRLIEFNARFGDPEVLNVLPLLETDFVDICQTIIDENLSEDLVRFAHKATVCKYIAPEGYPMNKDQRGQTVSLPVIPSNARLYYGDVSRMDDGKLLLGGSRTAGIVGIEDTIADAEKIAQSLCEKVKGPVRFRRDIGTEKFVKKRVEFMRSLRTY